MARTARDNPNLTGVTTEKHVLVVAVEDDANTLVTYLADDGSNIVKRTGSNTAPSGITFAAGANIGYTTDQSWGSETVRAFHLADLGTGAPATGVDYNQVGPRWGTSNGASDAPDLGQVKTLVLFLSDSHFESFNGGDGATPFLLDAENSGATNHLKVLGASSAKASVSIDTTYGHAFTSSSGFPDSSGPYKHALVIRKNTGSPYWQADIVPQGSTVGGSGSQQWNDNANLDSSALTGIKLCALFNTRNSIYSVFPGKGILLVAYDFRLSDSQVNELVGAPFAKTFESAADTEAPTVPTNLAVDSRTRSSITWDWSASTDNVGVTGYEVSENDGAAIDKGTNLSHTKSGLADGTSVNLKVRAYDAAGNRSAYTSNVQGTSYVGKWVLPANAAQSTSARLIVMATGTNPATVAQEGAVTADANGDFKLTDTTNAALDTQRLAIAHAYGGVPANSFNAAVGIATLTGE